MTRPDPLETYQRMRDFAQTPEPMGEVDQGSKTLSLVVQKHAARSLHCDFRLELDGTLKSWAVPRGPSLDPADKYMAVHVEDPPLSSYGGFEGVIPPGHCGAGTVIVGDRGVCAPLDDPHAGYANGKLSFELRGTKLRGRWALERMKRRGNERQEAWLLMKERDAHARSHDDFSIVEAEPGSVLGRGEPAAEAGTKIALRAQLSPQLATLVDAPPPVEGWACALLARAPNDLLHFSEAFDQDPTTLLESARHAGLEGLIGKRADAPYRSGRSSAWVKLKTGLRQEFVVGGFTEPQGARKGLGALLLGVHGPDGELRYAGSVGTGFDQATLTSLRSKLDRLRVDKPAFVNPPAKAGARGDQVPLWVKPRLLAEVSFAQWTASGSIRHAVSHGLRDDKPVKGITRDMPTKASAGRRASRALPATRITHADRVIDADSGVTKGELIAFYAEAAAVMLPRLKDRPTAFLRAPSGVGGTFFFQKHAQDAELPGVTLLDPALDPGHEPLLAIPGEAGLLAAAQMNVIEFHTWNAVARRIDAPDRIVFDLDPGSGVAWAAVRDAAVLLRGFLGELGLECLLKTSGGKGLHLVVPITPRLGWGAVKGFAQAVVQHMARVIPERFVAKSGPKNRIGKIYIDYLRNGFGATTVCAWSARARPGLGVSVPIAWDELAGLPGAAHWTVRNAAARIAIGNAPWAGTKTRQGLAGPMKKLGFDAEAAAR